MMVLIKNNISTILIIIGMLISAYIGRYLTLIERSIPDIEIASTHTISTCLEKRGAEAIKLNNVSLSREYLILCTEEVSKHLELNDFQIRRLKFFGQYYAERVSLWMVVFVTVSGVILSAIQILTSFKLASNSLNAGETSNEITVETGKIVIKSSAIGLMVLFTSLAFFMIFVINIYKIEEIKQEIKGGATPTPLNFIQQGPFIPHQAGKVLEVDAKQVPTATGQ
jgi:hypothetical protein